MSVEFRLTEINDCLRLEIDGDETSSYEDYVRVVEEAKRELAKYDEETELQTFVNVNHIAELEFFISCGFYVANTMIMMEKGLASEPVETKKNMSVSLLNVEEEGLERYLRANKAGFDGIQDPESQIRYQLGLQNGRIYIMEESGEIISSITVWDIDERTAATENIFTIPEYREKHKASELLEYVLSELVNRGKSVARLSVYGDDAPAHGLYLKYGYHIAEVNYELRF